MCGHLDSGHGHVGLKHQDQLPTEAQHDRPLHKLHQREGDKVLARREGASQHHVRHKDEEEEDLNGSTPDVGEVDGVNQVPQQDVGKLMPGRGGEERGPISFHIHTLHIHTCTVYMCVHTAKAARSPVCHDHQLCLNEWPGRKQGCFWPVSQHYHTARGGGGSQAPPFLNEILYDTQLWLFR